MGGECKADATGKAMCKCLAPWRGHTCEHRCPGSTDNSVCSAHGKCNYDEQQKVTFCACETGFLGKKCAVMCAKDSVCGGRGKCDLAKGGQTKCLCSKGYGGRTCSESCPFKAIGKGEPVPCSGKGSCVPKGSAMQCMCKEGWLGKDCSIPCPTSASGEIC